MGFNLHGLVRSIVGAVAPNVELVIIRCVGSTAENGFVRYQYGACELTSGQKQTLNGDEQQQVNGIMQGELGRKFYLSVSGTPLTAGHSVSSVAPSYLYEVATGDYWKVTNVSEDFHHVGWALVFAALQKMPPQEVALALKQSGLVGAAGPCSQATCSAQSSLLSGKDYELY